MAKTPNQAAAEMTAAQGDMINQTQSWSVKRLLRGFEKMFIYFWVVSLLGHYIELIWMQVNVFNGHSAWRILDFTIIPLAPPYGLGMVMVILLVYPLVKRYKMSPVAVFILNIIVTSVIEYICAVIIVAIFGHNQFWNYSYLPFNLSGYICLGNSLLFGIAATFFIYWFYPAMEKILQLLSDKQFRTIFWILFVSYGLDLAVSIFK